MSKSIKVPKAASLMQTETVAAIMSTDTLTEAAKLLGIHPATMNDRLRQYPEIIEAVKATKNQAVLMLHKASSRAANKIIDTLDDKKRGFDAARDILDRVGVHKVSGGVDDKPATSINIQLNIGGNREKVMQGN
jgi:hypothetical protein